MVLAPHPDDETLGAGGLLQRAAARGVPMRVVFATDGDDNPWPQRVVERRLWIDANARARWGSRRRGEGYAALEALGLPRECAVFLGLPDRGLTRLLLDQPTQAVRSLAAQIAEWRPSVLVMPSLRDQHPDHNALAVLTLVALWTFPVDERPIVLTYVVHPFDTALFPDGLGLRLTSTEQARKRQAVECHAAQLLFQRRVHRCATASLERFAVLSSALQVDVQTCVRDARLDEGTLCVRIVGWWWRLRPVRLLVVAWDSEGRPMALRLSLLPGRSRVVLRDRASGVVVGSGRRVVRGRVTRIVVRAPGAAGAARLFVKLVTRRRIFDRDGWIEGMVRGPRSEGAASTPLEMTNDRGCGVWPPDPIVGTSS
jgi:LmbE family N-acetylglucosaminyl deacetylase